MKLFTVEELRDFTISILALALIFAYPNLQEKFFLALVVIFLSFFLHEMGHKMWASKLDCTATFKMWPFGILAGLVTLVLPIRFFAPGYVEIVPYKFGRWGIKVIKVTPRDLGHIALAGVGINIIFAWLFGILSGEIFHLLAQINAMLAIFNLLPIPPLDGSKIMLWNFEMWGFLVLLTVLAFIVI